MKQSRLNFKVILIGLGVVAAAILVISLIGQPRQTTSVTAPTSTPTEAQTVQSVQATQVDFNPATTELPTLAPINPLGSLPTAAGATSQPVPAAKQATDTPQPTP